MTRLRPALLALLSLLLTLSVSAVSHAQINSASDSAGTVNGGEVTINANVSFSGLGGTVIAYAYEDGILQGGTISLSNGGNGNIWTSQYYLKGDYGPGATTHKWSFVVAATDRNGAVYTAQATGVVTQIPDPGPAITNVSFTPSALPTIRSTFTLNVTVTGLNAKDNFYGGGSVSASIYANGQQTFINGTLSNGGSGNVYSLTTSDNFNPTSIPVTYTAVVTATDNAGAFTTMTGAGSAVQQADAPPAISNATLSPGTIPSAGGSLTVSATVDDSAANSTGLQGVQATIYNNGKYVNSGLLSNGGNGNFYTGQVNVGSNTGSGPILYIGTVTASDNALAGTTMNAAGSCMQQADTPPVITNASITPSTLSPRGAQVNVNATITDSGANASGISQVYADIYSNGEYIWQEQLSNGGSGNQYTSVGGQPFVTPPNNSAGPVTFTALVLAQDVAGKQASAVSSNSCVQQTDNQPPVITNVQLTPNPLSAAGGVVTVTANVTDTGGNNTGVSQVTLRIPLANGGTVSTNLANTGGSAYSGTFTLPASAASSPNFWNVYLDVSDNARNGKEILIPFMQSAPANGPLMIANALVMPATLPGIGGTFTVSADVTPGSEIKSVEAVVFANGAPYLENVMAKTSGTTYSAQFTVPANTAGPRQTFTAVVVAYDTSNGSSVTSATGSCVQAVGDPLVITNAMLSPSSLPASGGSLNISAIITPGGPNSPGIDDVEFDLYNNGHFYGSFTSDDSRQVAVSGNMYSVVPGAAAIGPSGGSIYPIQNNFTVEVVARDKAGNGFGAWTPGSCVQQIDSQPPVVTNIAVLPSTLSAAGGVLNVSATVTDSGDSNSGVRDVELDIYRNGTLYTYGSLTGNEVTANGSTYTFDPQYSKAPANANSSPATYTVVVIATDKVGNTATVAGTEKCVEQNDNQVPTITNAQLTPLSLTATGGTLTLSATVTDSGGNNTGVNAVSAVIYANGNVIAGITLSNGGSGNVYTSGISGNPPIMVPVNNGPSPITYTALVEASDNAGHGVVMHAAGACVEPNDNQPPIISNVMLTPNPLSASGGNLTVTAVVTDDSGNNVGVQSVYAQFLQNSVPYGNKIQLTNTSGNTFIGTISGATGAPAPPNNSGDYIEYSVNVSATDNASNSSNATAGPIRQPSSATSLRRR